MMTDVLIIGGGLAGITAADTILQNSCLSVTLLQSGGGASPYIHAFCMPVGEDDSEALFLRDTLESGYHLNDPDLARRLCFGALELPEWFRELGCDLDRENGNVRLLRALGSTVPRIAGVQNSTGPAMLRRLRRRLMDSGRYRELSGCRALELAIRSGRVVGARCYSRETGRFFTISAGVVVLACGGFGRLFPESTNSPDIGGDGIAMAFGVGATLTDMEFIQFEPTAAVWPPQVAGKGIVTTMFYDGAVLRGADGRRFMPEYEEAGECVPKDVLSRRIFQELRAHGGTPNGGVWLDATGVPEEKWQGAYHPYLNRYLACGIDLRREPVEVAPAAHTTCGGVKIDGSCRTTVPGLLACGEVTGGIHGANRLGGNAGLETMVFGRIAGQTAIADRQDTPELPENPEMDRPPDVSVPVFRDALREILRVDCGVIRNAGGLSLGVRALGSLMAKLGDYRGSFEKHRLYNDLLTAKITMLSAAQRRCSAGCHCREDAIEESPYRVEIVNRDGAPLALRRSI